MYSPTVRGWCSSGFAVVYVFVRHTTTARHCTANDWRAVDGTAVYGSGMATSASGARVLTARGSALNFDGAWNDASGYKKPVVGLSDPGIGGYVCTSGGNSGVHCNLKVTGLATWTKDPSGGPLTVRIAQQQTPGAIAAAQGDSGGPVFTLSGANAATVLAAGMIQAISGTSPCGTLHVQAACSSTVLYTTESEVLASLGASLVTYP
jgi:hypothetical protein